MNLKIENVFSVIGLGWGDEGKGITVDYLCSQNPNAIVYRHSGGHQVGHTVKIGDNIHEFRHFGSGTFRDIPTLWDRHCTVSPLQFEIEFKEMQNKFGITPQLYCSEHSPVTTLYDIAYNRAKERQFKCGSTGVGFAATLQRHSLIPLFVMDLQYSFVVKQKLRNISVYYFDKVSKDGIGDLYLEELGELGKANYSTNVFEQSCEFFNDNMKLDNLLITDHYDTIICEGNQGVLLDKYHGFYPNVTYGFTTNRKVRFNDLKTYYVTRCYGTRHGAGPLTNENLDAPILKNTEFEVNHDNTWQEKFRTAILDYDMIEYAIKCDQSYNKNIMSNLVITCMDQIDNPQITKDGKIQDLTPSMFEHLVHWIYTNDSPESKTFKLCL